MGVLLRDDGIVPLICPTCQNVFAGFAQSIHASDHHSTLHGVVFDILVGSERRVGLAAVVPDDDRRMACRAVAREPVSPPSPRGFGATAFTRSASEGWWARQDSNLQPDRYERPALTIELQAPPECRIKRPATVPTPLTMLPAIRQCRVARFGTFAQPTALLSSCPARVTTARGFGFNPPTPRRIRPPCAISRSRRQQACRIRPASSASGFRRRRQAAPPAWDLSAPRRPPC